MHILSLFEMDAVHQQQLKALAPQAQWRYTTSDRLEEPDLDWADIILGNPPVSLLHGQENLKLICLNSAGSDAYVKQGRLHPKTLLTNASGAYGQAIAEYVLSYILYFYKNLHLYTANQRQHRWQYEGRIESLQGKKVLIVGSDLVSRTCDPTDRTTIILFGDGAGACVLGASDEPGTLAIKLSSDPKSGDLLRLPYPIRNNPHDEYLYMKGNEVFKRAVGVLSSLVTDTLEEAGVSYEDLDFLVPHQANLRIIAATARKLKMDMSQVIVTLDKQGNTSAASVPLALDEGVRSGRIKRGDMLLLESFGGGFVWGSALVRY